MNWTEFVHGVNVAASIHKHYDRVEYSPGEAKYEASVSTNHAGRGDRFGVRLSSSVYTKLNTACYRYCDTIRIERRADSNLA
jgi:hypothetical protein